MIKRELINQIKWIILAFFISFVLVSCFENTVLNDSVVVKAPNTFLGLNLFLEILIFFVFSTFVVFGIKGFFEMYSQKTSNVIIFISGVLLLFVNFILCYQILFQE
jgi:ABC-type transport system involved in multi-copper enzyme maturation permease subunit